MRSLCGNSPSSSSHFLYVMNSAILSVMLQFRNSNLVRRRPQIFSCDFDVTPTNQCARHRNIPSRPSRPQVRRQLTVALHPSPVREVQVALHEEEEK